MIRFDPAVGRFVTVRADEPGPASFIVRGAALDTRRRAPISGDLRLSDDAALASGHEAAHHLMAREFHVARSAAWLWPNAERNRICGVHKYANPGDLYGIGATMTALAGAVAEAILAGDTHVDDMASWVGTGDLMRANLRGIATADDLAASQQWPGIARYLRHRLMNDSGGGLMTQWKADADALRRDFRLGDVGRIAPPRDWHPGVIFG